MIECSAVHSWCFLAGLGRSDLLIYSSCLSRHQGSSAQLCIFLCVSLTTASSSGVSPVHSVALAFQFRTLCSDGRPQCCPTWGVPSKHGAGKRRWPFPYPWAQCASINPCFLDSGCVSSFLPQRIDLGLDIALAIKRFHFSNIWVFCCRSLPYSGTERTCHLWHFCASEWWLNGVPV